MARPKGLRLNRSALSDVLRFRRITMTQAADRAGIALTTLSGLAHGDHNASFQTAEKLAGGLDCSAETLFPELVFADLPPEALAS